MIFAIHLTITPDVIYMTIIPDVIHMTIIPVLSTAVPVGVVIIPHDSWHDSSHDRSHDSHTPTLRPESPLHTPGPSVCRFGMSRILAAVDKDGTQHAEPNHAADMRALDKGCLVEIPDDLRPGGRRE